MINPPVLVIVATLLPFLAAIVLVLRHLIVADKQNGLTLAKIASTGSFACAFVAAIQVSLTMIDGFSQSTVFKVFGQTIPIVVTYDRLTLVWMMLNSAMVTQILCFSRNRDQAKSRSSVILVLVLLGIFQAILLVNDSVWQWMLVSISNWIVCGTLWGKHPKQTLKVRVHHPLVMLALADLFWMLGLIGIYLVAGSQQISLLVDQNPYSSLSDSAASLLITSVMSLLISLIMRMGFFPTFFWTNEFCTSSERLALLGAFPLSISGYLLFRWLPILSLFPEPLTLLVGLSALSAILIAVSALFLTGLKQLQRLCSVLLSIIPIGIAASPQLWPQMAGFFAGVIIFQVTVSLSKEAPIESPRNSKTQAKLKWCSVVLLLCGTLGMEAIFRALQQPASMNGVELPSVILPLLVLTFGLFVFGLYEQFKETTSNSEAISQLHNPFNLISGMVLLAGASVVPFFLSPEIEFEFLFPFFVPTIFISVVLIARSLPAQVADTPLEPTSLVTLCKNDYYLETIVERGISIPVQVGVLVVHIFDQYVLQGLSLKLPTWLKNEVCETSQEIEEIETAGAEVRLILLSVAVVVLAIYFGIASP